MSETRKRLTGNECLTSPHDELANNTLLEFWQWAFSDLRSNDIRGIFAEWMVGQLLNAPSHVRDSWAEWDVRTKDGVRIEVKTSAYLQTWQQKRPSEIVFTRLCGRSLNVETNQYASSATYNADLYVFCVQVEKDPEKWDALDLSQWRFYLLPNADLSRRNTKSLSLGALAAMTDELKADEFCKRAKAAIKLITELR